MLDKLEAYKAKRTAFSSYVRNHMSDEKARELLIEADLAENAMLDEMVDIIGKLDVALAELDKTPAPASAPAFVDQHGRAI